MLKTKAFIRFFIAIGFGFFIGLTCNEQHAGAIDKKETTASHSKEEDPAHKAHHQGCLNAIETCEVGHAETKIEGDTLKVWFVGGGTDTGRAVRVPDQTINLTIITPDKKTKNLILYPKPNILAEEKPGDCSFFEGKAPWLIGLKEFNAAGKVNFKGKERNIIIEYPKGYDPD